jgi:WD40 repeat protein
LATGKGALVYEVQDRLSPASTSLCFSPNGCWLVCGPEGRIHAWKLDGERLQTAVTVSNQPGTVGSLIVSPDSLWLFCSMSSYEHPLDLLDLEALLVGETRWTQPHWPITDTGRPMAGLAISPDGRTLATGHYDFGPSRAAADTGRHFVVLWDLATLQERGRLKGHRNQITGVDFSPDSRYLAVASGPVTWIWELGALAAVAQIKVNVRHFKSVVFSPDGRWLVTARNDGTVKFYDTRTWSAGPTFDWQIGPVVSVAFARHGMLAACGSSTGKIVVWDVDD